MIDPASSTSSDSAGTWDGSSPEFDERRGRFATVSNREVKRVYGPDDVEELDYDRDLGDPGEYPFTRGIYRTMYRGRVWTMRQFAGYGTPEETNARYHYLLEEGQTGLSVAFDMPSLMGIDSDHPMSEGEVGKEGVAVDSLRDMEVLFEGIPLEDVSVSFTINPSAPVIYAMFVALARAQDVPPERINATFQNDMLKEFIAQKEWALPPRPSLELVIDTIEYAAEHHPRVKPVSISGYHIREAGSTAVQELAFTLADGFAYVEGCRERDLPVDEFAPQLSFFFNAHNSMFEEIAKYRAARRIWARTMKQRYEASDEDAMTLQFHTQTAGQSLTAQQPLNNVVRTAYQALAAVLGGTQSLHTNSYDEAFALPTQRAVKLALRTQQILAEETGAADVVDPLGGSYFVESLTDETEQAAREYLSEIRQRGDGSYREGVLRGIEEGWFQREIRDAAYEYQRRVEEEDEVVVGVNRHREETEEEIELLEVDEVKTQQRQRERLEEVRGARDDAEVRSSLERLRETVRKEKNIMPVMVEAVEAYATMGEIMGVLQDVHGTYREGLRATGSP